MTPSTTAPFSNLGSFLQFLESTGRLKRIKATVDKDWELACISRWAIESTARENAYALLFENVKGYRVRRVSFRDEIQGRTLIFLTNNFVLPAETIAALYKSRWEIELFFKWIKLNLRVKTCYGTSPNAVKTQIWIAMIVYLVLAILRQRYGLQPSLSKLLHFLEVNLFEPKPLTSIFQPNSRASRRLDSKQLKLFDF